MYMGTVVTVYDSIYIWSQCVTLHSHTHCNTLQHALLIVLQWGSVRCSVLRNVAVCCSVLGFKFEGHTPVQTRKAHGKLESGSQHTATYSSHRVAGGFSSLRGAAAKCCSVLQTIWIQIRGSFVIADPEGTWQA